MRMQNKRVGVLLLTLCLLMVPVNVALAADNGELPNDADNGELPNDEWLYRELEIGVYDDYVEIMSYSGNETHETEIEIRLYTEGGEGPITIELEYEAQAETQAGTREDYLELRVTFEALVEYIDVNADGVFTEGIDELVQEVLLGDRGIVMYQPPTAVIVEGDPIGYKINALGTIPLDPWHFNFSITGYIFEAPTTIFGLDVSSTEMKIAIGIDGFPFEEGNSDLALRTIVRTEEEIEETVGDTYRYTWMESNTATGYFKWENTAIVDGVIKPVNSTTVEKEGEWFVYLCYPRGEKIVHDPRIGAEIKASALWAWPEQVRLVTPEILVGAAIIAAALVGVAIALSRRRKMPPLKSPSLPAAV